MTRPALPVEICQLYLRYVRGIQVSFALTYLILICYSAAHRGWWVHVEKGLGSGIFISIITFIVAIPDLLKYQYKLPDNLRAFTVNSLRVVGEIVFAALWITAFICMLAYKGKDFKHAFDRPPYTTWNIAVVIAGIQSTFFLLSMTLILQEKYSIDYLPSAWIWFQYRGGHVRSGQA